jgi:hypothetical protein
MKESGCHRNFERFLTRHMTARCLCQRCALDDLANELIPVFFELQIAHNSIGPREARALVLAIIKPIHAGRIQADEPLKAQVAELLGVSVAERDGLEGRPEPQNSSRQTQHQ